ncbi:MAG: hypothetical protein ACD_75C02627G0001 [uncultured bacterium]|nr:MAG: hypothetical protein ACD_75C02627G0001 [uncultured bacterium]
MIIRTMSGLPTSTKMEKTSDAPNCEPTMDQSNRAPRSMKKNSRRKSRRPVSRAPIESLKAVDASETPARNAPTSLLKPNSSLAAPRTIAHAIAKRVNSSSEFERRWVR